jgi:hypothetical protein
MEVRPYVKAGVAVASAGALIAAMPAITPPAAAPEVTVAAAVPDSVYADVALRQSTEDLFNAFFSGYPNTTGPAGAVGLALLFSDELFGEGSPPSAFVEGGIVGLAAQLSAANPLLNAFFAGGPNDTPGGIVGVLDLLTLADPLSNAFITGGIVGLAAELSGDGTLLNAFFAGGPNDTPGGIVGVADFLTDDAGPLANPLANAFVTGGVVGVADFLTQDNELVNTFVNGGFVALTEAVLLNLTADPVAEGAITSFFSGYPPAGPDDDPPIGPAGIVGLTQFILDALTGGIQTAPEPAPTMEELTVEQFSVPESGASLLAATTGPAGTQDLPEANEPVNPGARTFDLNVGTQLNTGAVDPVDIIDPVDTTDPTTLDTTDPTTLDTTDPTTLDTTDPTTLGASDPNPTVTPVAAATGAEFTDTAPAAQPPVAPSPPTTDPVVDPADQVTNEDDGDANEVTEEELNSGNKVEPDPILFENGTGGGGSAWDETVKRWQDFGAKLGFGGGPADADGETEGSEAGN